MSVPTISDYEIQAGLNRLNQSIDRRIEKHGREPHHSVHESLGICMEEMYEVQKAIHENQDPVIIAKELRDLAVAASWGMISLEGKR